MVLVEVLDFIVHIDGCIHVLLHLECDLARRAERAHNLISIVDVLGVVALSHHLWGFHDPAHGHEKGAAH